MVSLESFANSKLNPFLPQHRSNPYPIYHQLRAAAPVCWAPNLFGATPELWLVTGYREVDLILRDHRFIREAARIFPPEMLPPPPPEYRSLLEMVCQWMLLRDPPDHTRLRALVNKAFTPRVVESLRPRIESITNELIDQLKQSEPLEQSEQLGLTRASGIDLISQFAFPLPMIIIAEMLGVPAQDRQLFRHWSTQILGAIDLNQNLAKYQQAAQVTDQFRDYLKLMIAERRRQPKDDLLSALIAAEEQGDRLSTEELYSTAILLLFAGHETTVNLIGNGLLALLRNPAERELLKQAPRLLPGAIEELLRYDSPVQVTIRLANEDLELAGAEIRRGQVIGICLAAANRDPAQFADPDRLDLQRADNRHVAFGFGIHFCVGAALARLEGQIAIGTILSRLPDLQLSDQPLCWRDTVAMRGLVQLPVTI